MQKREKVYEVQPFDYDNEIVLCKAVVKKYFFWCDNATKEDLVQTAIITLWKKRNTYKPEKEMEFYSFLFNLAHFSMLTYLSKEERRFKGEERPISLDSPLSANSDFSYYDIIPIESENFTKEEEFKLLKSQIKTALKDFSPKHQKIILSLLKYRFFEVRDKKLSKDGIFRNLKVSSSLVCKEFNISRQGIAHIFDKFKNKLREIMRYNNLSIEEVEEEEKAERLRKKKKFYDDYRRNYERIKKKKCESI